MQITYHTVLDTVSVITLGHKDKNGEWTNSKEDYYDRNEIKTLAQAWNGLLEKI